MFILINGVLYNKFFIISAKPAKAPNVGTELKTADGGVLFLDSTFEETAKELGVELPIKEEVTVTEDIAEKLQHEVVKLNKMATPA